MYIFHCAEIIPIFRKFKKKKNKFTFYTSFVKKKSITFDNPYDKIILKKICILSLVIQ